MVERKKLNDSEKLNKWDLSHLNELIYLYGFPYNMDNRFVLHKNGNAIIYYRSPKWWARTTNKTDNVHFLELCRTIYHNMMGISKDPNNDAGFSQLYFEGNKKDLIDVLFFLHFCKITGELEETDSQTKSPDSSRTFSHIAVSDSPSESYNIHLADGVYRANLYPFVGLLKKGPPIDFYELLRTFKNK